jgi:glycosyltransferase involved in cell wall biosynthesis
MVKNNPEKSTFKILYCSIALTVGGEQTQLVKRLKYIDRTRFQSIVCCVRLYKYVEPAIQNLASKFLCLQVRGRYNLLGEVYKLRRAIKEHNIDLVVTGIFGSDFSPLLAALVARVPAVAFLTTTYDLGARSTAASGSVILYWKSRIFFIIHAILARLIKIHYIAYSDTIKESAAENLHLPRERISIIPLGLNPDEFDAGSLPQDTTIRIKDELGLNSAYPVLLNVARLSPVKGQKELLESMPQILAHFPQAVLLIAGGGPAQFTQELAGLRDSLGLAGHVQLLGHRSDIAALLHISEIFVLTSYYEGLPGSVIEAMAAGKPVVAFDIPAIRELVRDGDTGILVRERKPAYFAGSIIQLAEHPEAARQMGEQAQRLVRAKYNIKQNIKGLEALYERMLTRPSGRSGDTRRREK